MNSNKISIIIPAYNAEKTIEKSVLSAVQADYSDKEILVVDDGSKDSTAKIVTRLACSYSEIKVISVSNGGVSRARNLGIQNASGNYIMFLDSDDTYDSRICAMLMNKLQSDSADMALCGYYEIFAKNTITCLCPAPPLMATPEEIAEKFIHPVLLSGTNSFMGSVWNGLFKKSIILENNIFFNPEVRFAEDALFLLEYLLHCKSVSVVGEPLYNYMLNTGSVTKNYSATLQENDKAFIEARNKILASANIEVTEQMQAKFALRNFYSTVVNEAREGNPKKFSKKLKQVTAARKTLRRQIAALEPQSKNEKIKRMVALSPILGYCFFCVRCLQRRMGVYF